MNHDNVAITNIAENALNQPTLSTDEVWAIEAESRLAAFKAGQVEAIPAAVQVLAKHLGPGIEKSGTENLELSIDAIQAILRAVREEPIGDYTFG